MRRILFLFISSVCVSLLCISGYADENPPVRPYVEQNSSNVAETAPSAVQPGPEAPAAPVATPVTTPGASIRIPNLNGDWCGSWQSCTNGHKGPMRASFCRLCDGNYKVTFTGRFCKLIPFRYSTTLNVTGYTDGVVYLSGSQNLGPIFGTFTYNAWANDRQFASGYSANKDQGQFVLAR